MPDTEEIPTAFATSIFHPAIAITNIKNMIPITLDTDQTQYSSWVELFKVTATAADVLNHIDPAVPRPSSISASLWLRLDAIVKQWLYATISPSLLQTILKPNSAAQQTWDRLRALFEDNKHTRILNLESKFSNLQLDQFANCTEYCHAIKVISDQLANLGSPLDDGKLVLRLVKGLHNSDYKSVATFISQSEPLPSFSKARSMLLFEETNHAAAPPPSVAFVTALAV